MPNVNLDARQIKGLVPALESKQIDKPFCMFQTSKNFLIDLKGPYAAFSNRILFYDYLTNPNLSQTVRLLGNSIILTVGAVLQYDTASGRYYPVFLFPDQGLTWPWSFAEVSGKFYFCRRGAGVFQFDPVTNNWATLVTFVPPNPTSICASQGRLIIMGDNQTSWSALDDGTNLTPSLVTGAGFQGLNIVGGKGYALGVLPTSDGWINYTQKGCFKSELSDGPNPFRHYLLQDSKSVIPINQFCMVNDDNFNNIVLTRKGFYISAGGPFQIYEQIFGEWLSHEFITVDMINVPTLLRLWFNDDNKFLILSVANAANPTVFNRAFILYLPKDEWGSFDYNHTAFGEISLNFGADFGFSFGFFDQFGYFHKFITDVFNEIAPTPAASMLFMWQPDFQMAARNQDGTTLFPSLIKMSDLNDGGLSNTSAGFYTIGVKPSIIDPGNIDTMTADFTFPPINPIVTFDNWMGTQYTETLNIMQWSNNFAKNPPWLAAGGGGVGLTPNAINSVRGILDATKFIEVGAGTNHILSSNGLPALTANTLYEFSVEFKAAERSAVQLSFLAKDNTQVGAGFDLIGGNVFNGGAQSASIVPLGNGWFRCVMVVNSKIGASAGIFFIATSTFVGDGVSGFYMTAAQISLFNAAATPAPYHPTAAVGDPYVDYNQIFDGTQDEDYLTAGDAWFRFESSFYMAFGEALQTFAPYVPANNPLGSLIDVGLFRYQEQKYSDELGVVSDVAIGIDAIPGPAILEDYQLESPPTEDWNITNPNSFEDYGFGYVQTTTFGAAMIGTLDGINQWQDQFVPLVLREDDGNRQYFACLCTGAYLILRMSALNVNETFHLKSLDLSGTLAGRL